jgi:hypothetical protein
MNPSPEQIAADLAAFITPGPGDTVVKKLVLQDEAGVTRAVLGMNPHGAAMLVMLNSAGEPKLIAKVGINTELRMEGADGNRLVAIASHNGSLAVTATVDDVVRHALKVNTVGDLGLLDGDKWRFSQSRSAGKIERVEPPAQNSETWWH